VTPGEPGASTRGAVEGLETPTPILASLPAFYQEYDFTSRFTLAFDDGLSPVVLTLDNLDAYVDPALAPSDFVLWLAEWVGFPLAETWPLEQSRRLISQAVELYRWWGTVRGLRSLLTAHIGIEPEIVETGGVTWSSTPGAQPGDQPAPRPRKGKGSRATKGARDSERGSQAAADAAPGPHLLVRVRAPRAGGVDVRQVEALIRAAKPAHVPHTLEVIG
jgi:phage tail-like protein